MGYRLLADAVMTLHFAFLGYVVLGGFLTWWWRWTLLPHLLAAGWGVFNLVFPAATSCPLTRWESLARRAAGDEGLPRGGFINHYVVDVVYPAAYSDLVRVLVMAVVLGSWLGLWLRTRRATQAPAAP